ncbi:MAG: GNAT family N-acetyltransferase [Acidimicrobiia bacterium]|nr:GNAT family N-acetyltransferase [Acidimicrobiia bacterium]
MSSPELRTERLLLRRWRDADRAPFAAVNADVAVMRHFAGPLDRAASDALIDRIERSFEEAGYSLWAVELPGEAACIGFVGLWRPAILAGVTDAVEVGWRLGSNRWGRGYATEGARAALAFAFDELGLDEVVSCTTPTNRPSLRVMEKLGMTRDPADDFVRPGPDGADRTLVLHRLPAGRWRGSGGAGP